MTPAEIRAQILAVQAACPNRGDVSESVDGAREADRVAAFCVSGLGHDWDHLAEYEPETRDTPGIPGDAWACHTCGHELYRDHATGCLYMDGAPLRTELRTA